jgi:hypothetical protein
MMPKTRFIVVREAVEVLLGHLECLPQSARTEQLHAWVRDCLRETEQWSASPPTDQARDVIMKRVLALHVEVTRLERQARLAGAKGIGCDPAN